MFSPKVRHFLLILLFSLAAFFMHGYQFAVSDQAIFIPYILKSQDPTLFPNDPLFGQPSATASLFYPIFGFLTRYINIQSVFFASYIIFQFLFFTAVYSLAKIILHNKKLAYLSLIPFFLPKFIGGTSTLTFDTYFGYRSAGVIFFLYFLTYIFEKKYYKAAAVSSLGFWFHPLSIIPTILILPASITSDLKKWPEKLIKSTAIFVAILSPFLLFVEARSLNTSVLSGVFNDQWLSIIKQRDSYLFATSWNLIEWSAIVFYLILILIFVNRLNIRIRKSIQVICYTSLVLFAVNLLILDFLKVPIVAQFQLLRSITPLAYIAFITTPLFLTYENFILKILGLVAFISLSINVYPVLVISSFSFISIFLFKKPKEFISVSKKHLYLVFASIILIYLILNIKSFKDLNQKYQIPKPYNYWIDVQKWAKANTAKSDVFVVLPRQIGFRIFSHRSIVNDIKDGAVVMYDPSYAKYWSAVSYDFDNFYALSKQDLINLKRKYNFKYVVTVKTHQLDFEVLYKNDYYVVYKI